MTSLVVLFRFWRHVLNCLLADLATRHVLNAAEYLHTVLYLDINTGPLMCYGLLSISPLIHSRLSGCGNAEL